MFISGAVVNFMAELYSVSKIDSKLQNFSRNLLARKLVAVWAMDVVPFVRMSTKRPKGVDKIFIAKVVWLVLCPVMEVKRCSIAPNKCPVRVDIRQAQSKRVLHLVGSQPSVCFLLAVFLCVCWLFDSLFFWENNSQKNNLRKGGIFGKKQQPLPWRNLPPFLTFCL